MTISPTARTILCYGDSNTWGQKPDRSGRYPVGVRWTSILQEALGDEYYIIEEGLGGRTTDLEYKRKPGRNGKLYLSPCLESHSPIAIVVLMLGTNDLKIEFDRSSEAVSSAMSGLLDLIKIKTSGQAKVLLISPILINDEAINFAKYYIPEFYDHESAVKSQQLGHAFEVLAQTTGCEFLDASKFAQAGEDGIHLSQASHASLAAALINKVKSMQQQTDTEQPADDYSIVPAA